MLIHKHRANISVSSATGSGNTLKFSGAQLIQLFLKSTTPTNIFDFSMVDEDNDVVYEIEAIEGEHEEHSVYLPLRGVYTLRITAATIDEVVVAKIMVEE
jgi:hypothetical protein